MFNARLLFEVYAPGCGKLSCFWWSCGYRACAQLHYRSLLLFWCVDSLTNNPPKGDRSAGFYIKFYIFYWILIDSGLKLLLYGTRIRINYCPPGNIGNRGLQHYLQSWKDGTLDFSNFSYPGNIGKLFFNFLTSWKYWIVRSILSSILEIVDRTIHISVLSWK